MLCSSAVVFSSCTFPTTQTSLSHSYLQVFMSQLHRSHFLTVSYVPTTQTPLPSELPILHEIRLCPVTGTRCTTDQQTVKQTAGLYQHLLHPSATNLTYAGKQPMVPLVARTDHRTLRVHNSVNNNNSLLTSTIVLIFC